MIIKLNLIKMDNLIKKIVIAFLLIISDMTYSANVLVSDINFDGLQRVSLDTILFNFPLKIGVLIDDDIISDSIKVLFSTGYFEDIKIYSNDTGIITIQVKEYPIINNINYYGNKAIKKDMVTRILDLKKIQSGQSLNNCSIFEAEHDLQDMCFSLGKFNAMINIAILPISRNRVDLKIMITEGKSAIIKQINIIGNHVFHKKKLLSKFQLCNKTQWWNILFNKQYETQKLLHDLEILRNFYLNNGYAKFNIDSTKINLTLDKKNIDLCVYITEGTQYVFSSITLYGDILNTIPDIKNCICINPGELYSNSKIREIEHNIQYILKTYGYMQSSVSIEHSINEKNKTIRLYVYIDAGNRYYVHEIYFEGNILTKDSVIRREIKQMEKTQLDYSCVLEDKERLKRLNYFKKVDIDIKYLPNVLNQVDIIYQVEESNAGNLTLSVGVGTESGINAQFGMHQDNFLGTGNSISITSAKNNYQTYVDISSTQFFYNIDRINIGEKIFYNSMSTNYADLSNYSLKNYGIDINCSYSFIKYHTFNIGLNYIYNYLSKITPQVAIWRYLKSINIYPELIINTFFNKNIHFFTNDFILTSGWTFNNLDHLYFPTTGLYFNILSKLTLPGSNNKYYKIIIYGNHYLPLDQNSNWILMFSTYAGYSGGINKKESPFYDNFYAGGINTIRGFRLNSIGPKAAYYHCNKSDKSYSTCSVKDSQDAIGGNAVSLCKTELIVPITYLNEQYSDITRISIFVDAGTVWDTFWKSTEMTRAAGIIDYSISNNIRISSGISLKWMSPVGPVIFSYSKLLKKYSGDIEEPFQFSIGKSW